MKFDIHVHLYCNSVNEKAFTYEYIERVECELEDKNGQFSHIIAGAIDKAITRVEQEYQNCNVEVIHCYKVKEW